MITEEEVKKLPYITLEEFNIKFEKLKSENFVVRKLFEINSTWETFAPHLLRDLFVRIGARPEMNKY